MKRMARYKFLEQFRRGTSSAAIQIKKAAGEGEKERHILSYRYGTRLDRIHNRVGPVDTTKLYHTYEQDLEMMYLLGHKSFCFSISWPRLIPEGKGEVSFEAVVFYNRLINKALYYGMEPVINLFHIDTPVTMQQIGGWENREVVKAYEKYAKTCFLLFGDRVKKWFTHSEPTVHVEGGYVYGSHYPNVVDFKRAVQVAYHTILSNALAVRAYRESRQDGKIGIILNLTPSYPKSQNPADLKASQLADTIFNRSFLDPSMTGEFPADLVRFLKEHNFLPKLEEGDKEIIKEHTIDLLGINYYQIRYVKVKESMPYSDAPFMPEHLFDNYTMPGRKMNVYRSRKMYEKGFYNILINLKENYGNIECCSPKNGMGKRKKHILCKML